MTPNLNEPIPISALRNLLLPADLSIELCIAGITVTPDGQALRFRLDPGRSFAQYGFVLDTEDGLYEVGMLQRYLPHDKLKPIGGSFGLRLCDVPDELRAISGRAYDQLANRPHWLDACPYQPGGWQTIERGLSDEAARRAMITALTRVGDGHWPAYVTVNDSGVVVTDDPPIDGSFLSVTDRGEWARHDRSHTYPIEGVPTATALFSTRSSPVFPPISFPRGLRRSGADGVRISGIDLGALRPELAPYRGPRDGPGRRGRTP